ncbi:hypothetical protein RHSIM_Rhsim04G0032600 [Rhododendron simsii]|uniref:DEAD-box RNA helicase Q domain-containing protein n=1 Tax=Rhododendron simsii TaxID=118357 RepID=A0A834LQS7_RHOSS|nr:hypothetical protein RHSIM_Rhsim04G0032600 [Rhododendron simsii]
MLMTHDVHFLFMAMFTHPDLNVTSELNYNNPTQESTRPSTLRIAIEMGVSLTNDGEEVFNADTATARSGISGGSVDSVIRDVEPIAEVSENQGQMGEFVPDPCLMGDFVLEEIYREKHHGGNQDLMLLCPNNFVGSVIGKAGRLLNSIKLETNARVKVGDPVVGSDDRVITIYCYVKKIEDLKIGDDFDDGKPPAHQGRLSLPEFDGALRDTNQAAHIFEMRLRLAGFRGFSVYEEEKIFDRLNGFAERMLRILPILGFMYFVDEKEARNDRLQFVDEEEARNDRSVETRSECLVGIVMLVLPVTSDALMMALLVNSHQGYNVPPPFASFDTTGLPSELLREVHQAGFSVPTLIHAQSWPIALQDLDIVLLGRHVKSAIPSNLGFVHLNSRCNNPQMGPSVLVLSPTREFASKIHDESVQFGKSSQISCTIGSIPGGGYWYSWPTYPV